jgi:hypothetical protein
MISWRVLLIRSPPPRRSSEGRAESEPQEPSDEVGDHRDRDQDAWAVVLVSAAGHVLGPIQKGCSGKSCQQDEHLPFGNEGSDGSTE